MEKVFDLISSNFALILSSAVSVIAVFATIYQSYNSRRTQAMEMYFAAQLEAYSTFLDTVSCLEVKRSQEKEIAQKFLSSSNKVLMLSTPATASVIDDFCRTYLTLLENLATGAPTDNITAIFEHERTRLIKQLNLELSKYDSQLVNKANHHKYSKGK